MSEIKQILGRLASGAELQDAEAVALFEGMLAGALDDAQLSAALSMITLRGPTVDELVAGAGVLRRHAVPVPLDGLRRADGSLPAVLDTCGTGGAPKTFNVSTAVALVTAAAGRGVLVVAKHGGRSRSGRGSAEVLQHLGVNVHAPAPVQARCLAEVGVCFAFAVNHHPAMKHAAGVRQALGFPTILNLLGPLANPAGATRQVVGTFSPEHALKLAHALRRLGAQRAMVVTSADGMDELTTTDENIVHEVTPAGVVTRTLDAASLGLRRAARQELQTDSLERSAALLRDVLAGKAGAARDVVALNAAAALVVCDAAADMVSGLKKAETAIDSGAALRTLEELVRLSNS